MTVPSIRQPHSEGRHKTILVDPPWAVHQHAGNWSGAGCHYGPLPDAEIMALLVRDVAADNAHVWRWATNATLRSATEYLLFGTRGRAPVRGQPNWLFAPHQDHSHKPKVPYVVIERVGEGPYLELFARRRQPGWHVWGNEIDSDVLVPGFPVPSDQLRGVGNEASA